MIHAPCTYRPCVAWRAKQPQGFVQWHEWTQHLRATHDQLRCPSCGLWTLWLFSRDQENKRQQG